MGLRELAGSLLTCAFLLGTPVLSYQVSSQSCRPADENATIYNFEASNILETRNISLSEYQGKVVLVVNVATYCLFTWMYKPLNALKAEFGKEGFEILGFPSNEFGMYEPGDTGEEILNGIKCVRPGDGFVPNFEMFKKIDVNGENEHPLYNFLKSQCPPTRDSFYPQWRLYYTPMNSSDIRWNFEKILVDRTGKPVTRYDPSTEPDDIREDILSLLSDQRR